MTKSTPDPRGSAALTPEERSLAARLARVGPRGEPPASLDAAIIGAAHAAAGRRAPGHGRWPALLGVAATLALAVGLGWQLRPSAELPVAGDERPTGHPRSAAVERAADPARDAAPPALAEEPGISASPPGEPPRTLAPAAARQQRGKTTARSESELMATLPASPAPPPAPPVPSPAPPPPPAPSAPSLVETAPAAKQAIDAASAQAQREATSSRMEDLSTRPDAARTRSDSTTAAAAPVAFPADEVDLPVAQDQQLEPAAWLERIRARRDAGDIAGARESLRMLRRSHPGVVVPDDLRELIDEGRP